MTYRIPKSKLPFNERLRDPVRTYEIIETATGKVVVYSHSHRPYIAMLVSWDKTGRFLVLARFGREDLIGKGQSKHLVNRDDCFLARLKSH